VNIFIDESGTFTTRSDGSSVGAIGALVVTESQMPIVERRYEQLRPLLPKVNGEVKGRVLAEGDIARVLELARRSGLIYEVTVIDLLPEDGAAVEEHRKQQCDMLTRRLTDDHQATLVSQLWALRARLEKMSLPLYAQFVGTGDLLWRTLEHATLYYSQREPASLARFRWMIDAKAPDGITDWEDWWTKVVKPILQSKSLRQPFAMFKDGDYSFLRAKEMPMPEHLVGAFPRLKGETGLSLNECFEEIAFSAEAVPGLELVDVLTNAVRRALTGRLGERGWQGIPGLMIHRKGSTYVHPIGFGNDGRPVDPAAGAVMQRLGTGGRSMLR
jgi:hypothetical protein